MCLGEVDELLSKGQIRRGKEFQSISLCTTKFQDLRIRYVLDLTRLGVLTYFDLLGMLPKKRRPNGER